MAASKLRFKFVNGDGWLAFFDEQWHYTMRTDEEIRGMVERGVAIVDADSHRMVAGKDDDPRPNEQLETMGETLDEAIPDDFIGYLV